MGIEESTKDNKGATEKKAENKIIKYLIEHRVDVKSPDGIVACFNALYAVNRNEAWRYAENEGVYGLTKLLKDEYGISDEYGRGDVLHYLLNGGDDKNIRVSGSNAEVVG